MFLKMLEFKNVSANDKAHDDKLHQIQYRSIYKKGQQNLRKKYLQATIIDNSSLNYNSCN